MEEPSHRTESEAGGDDHQPLRRPMNAFLLFCKRHRRVVKSQHPWLDNRSCTKMLADMWAVLDGEEKSKYLQLARECKAAFMKAHPGYKWCGSSKQNVKPMSPTVTTRTKLPITPPCDGAPEVRLAGHDKNRSRVGITPGKLADPSEMGGLSLLLLAGQHAMGKVPTTPPPSETEPLEDAGVSEELSSDTKSRLFEFAEMCTSHQMMESHTTSPKPSTLTTPVTPILPDDLSERTNQKSPEHIKDLKIEPPASLDLANNNNPTQMGLEGKAAFKEKKGHKKGKKRNKGEKKKKKSSHKSICESKTCSTKKEGEDNDANRVIEVKPEVKGEVMSKVKYDVKPEVKGDEDEMVDDLDGNKNSSASYDDKYEEEEELPSGRRKSSRSCKGRLYRQMVMGGMLESLQRPERPFNCKKPWRHGESTCYSDGDDAVFEPEPEKPKRPSRRKARKRTLSGCGISLPADFDYGEIDVEARLATLPQYSPDQFQPKGRHFQRAKRSSSLYKNAVFVKKEFRDYHRSISNPEGGRSAPTSPTQTYQHSPLTGSQKRKARKSSIMHLTATQSGGKTDAVSNENKSMKQMPDTYSEQTKSTRVRLEFKPSVYSKNSNNNDEHQVSSNSMDYSSSQTQTNGCGSVVIANREPRSASQKPCSSSRPTSTPASLTIGMQPTLTVP